MRLLSILAGAFLVWLNWSNGALFIVPIITLAFAAFLVLVSRDLNNQENIDHFLKLIHINEQELLYLHHKFTHQEDGVQFLDEQHPFASDLDIFGRSSIYQYINRANSEQGKKLLSAWLLAPAQKGVILARQKAVQELSGKTEWIQDLQARTAGSQVRIATQQTIEQWLSEGSSFIHKQGWQLVRFVVPALALSCVGLYIIDYFSYQQFLVSMVVCFAIATLISRKVYPLYRQLDKISADIKTLSNSIASIENENFQDPMLRQVQQQVKTGSGLASGLIKDLDKIVSRFEYRLNPIVFIPLNTLFLWDLQVALQLEAWKEKNNQQVGQWFDTLAVFEVLCSLGTLTFNHPDWCFADINDAEPEIRGEALGHPLIEKGKSVVNDFSTLGKAQINIITGSNMAGKSTFLRTIGVNMVLSAMGAPACARSLTIAPLMVMSSMRIKDNLEESTSTFYAELKKLKTIIDAVRAKAPVFILLDEILRGTNSHDRHLGSKALIRQLIHESATGIVATHDLELADLIAEFPSGIHNYHFDVQIQGEELFFDYKLKTGICQSLNASLLMKKIGIEL